MLGIRVTVFWHRPFGTRLVVIKNIAYQAFKKQTCMFLCKAFNSSLFLWYNCHHLAHSVDNSQKNNQETSSNSLNCFVGGVNSNL